MKQRLTPIKLHGDGIPILDAQVTRPNRLDPRFGIVELVHPCPFCGVHHSHGDDIAIKVGTLTHRVAHCPTVDRRGRPVNRPERGYYLRIVPGRVIA